MKITKSLNNLQNKTRNTFDCYFQVALIFLFLNLLLDPTNRILGLKTISLVIVIFMSLFLVKKQKTKKIFVYVLFLFFLIPNFYSGLIGLSVINQFFSFENFKFYLTGSFFGVLIVMLNFSKKDLIFKAFLKSMCVYSIIYLVIILSFHYTNIDILTSIYKFSIEKENMMISRGPFLEYNIFYKTSPVLILYFAYLIFYNKFLWSLVIAFLIIVSGTSANILALILVTGFYVNFRILKKFSNEMRVVLFGLIGITMILIFRNHIFDPVDQGNSLKYLDIKSYFDYWASNLKDFVLGMGAGSGFFSYGRVKIVYNTEMTYLEILRKYGLIVSINMLLILLLPLKNLIKNKKDIWLFISYLAYLFIGGTNPLIIGSTGALVIIFVYSYTYNSN